MAIPEIMSDFPGQSDPNEKLVLHAARGLSCGFGRQIRRQRFPCRQTSPKRWDSPGLAVILTFHETVLTEITDNSDSLVCADESWLRRIQRKSS